MNKIDFFKYHGTANDFIMIDNREGDIHLSQTVIENLCNRRTGIGADGLITLEKTDSYAFSMKYYNSDGKEGTMCGNGGRCTAVFARDVNAFSSNKVKFEAIDGLHIAELEDYLSFNETIVNLKMGDTQKPIKNKLGYFLDTGSPHLIQFLNKDEYEKIDVFKYGSEIRHHELFKGQGGTNVNFVFVTDNHLKIKTFERGVEDETYSCGTGAVAAAIIASEKYEDVKSPVNLINKGGALTVTFKEEKDNYSDIWLKGPAKFVFKGTIKID